MAILLFVFTASLSRAADGVIDINISVKMILHPDDGLWPRKTADAPATRITQSEIDAAFAGANALIASYRRGYRLKLVEVLEIGGVGQDHSNQPKTAPGYYAIQDSAAAPLVFEHPAGYTLHGQPKASGALIDVLDQNARSSAAAKLAFKWNDNAVNLFVPSGWGGGGGISPANGNAAGFGDFEVWLLVHELGHYFDLSHTFDLPDDGIADTLLDPQDTGRDAVASDLFNSKYALLNAAQKNAVDLNCGQDKIAITYFGDYYANLTTFQQSIVDDPLTQENISQAYFGVSYSSLTQAQRDQVADYSSKPRFVDVGKDSLAIKLFQKRYDNTLTAPERQTVTDTYSTLCRNRIARVNGLGGDYTLLSSADQTRVNNVFRNIMSYNDFYDRGATTTVMTQDQLDHWTDTTNQARAETSSGRTLFVGGSVTDDTKAKGSSKNPYLTLPEALSNTTPTEITIQPAGKDIVLLRPGTYTATTLNKPVTIRSAVGSVSIQHP